MLGNSYSDIIENEEYDENNNIEFEQKPWKIWRKLRTLCEESPKLFLALELTEDLPNDQMIDRWYSEPVKCIIIPTSLFITNRSGFPVLSKAHQHILHKFMSV